MISFGPQPDAECNECWLNYFRQGVDLKFEKETIKVNKKKRKEYTFEQFLKDNNVDLNNLFKK